MAFKIFATLKGYRVLGVKSGMSKANKPWVSVDLFRDGASCEVSTTDSDMMLACRQLQELDVINCDVVAVAGKERSYLILNSAPVLVSSASGGMVGDGSVY